MDTNYKKLIEGNRQWAEETKADNPDFFTNLAKGQAPKFLWIGCADSRVPAAKISKMGPGDIFVHRNIANMVVHTDISMLSVLEYAVAVLKVEHVVICGHYGCGGVRAAMDHAKVGLIDNWLLQIKESIRANYEEQNAISDDNDKFNRAVELNVMEQVYNMCSTAIIQEAWAERKVQVHGMVFQLDNGMLKELVTINKNSDLSKHYDFHGKY